MDSQHDASILKNIHNQQNNLNNLNNLNNPNNSNNPNNLMSQMGPPMGMRIPVPLDQSTVPKHWPMNHQNSMFTGIPPNPKPKKDTTFTNYIIIPLLLAICFVLLVYPTTSKFIEKFVPPMINMKGYLIRGLILGLVYMVIKFTADSIQK